MTADPRIVKAVFYRCLRDWADPSWIGGVSTERQILYFEGWRARIAAALKEAEKNAA